MVQKALSDDFAAAPAAVAHEQLTQVDGVAQVMKEFKCATFPVSSICISPTSQDGQPACRDPSYLEPTA